MMMRTADGELKSCPKKYLSAGQFWSLDKFELFFTTLNFGQLSTLVNFGLWTTFNAGQH